MGVKQFLGIKWIEDSPQMLFYDTITRTIEYEKCEGFISLQRTNQKRCKGYYDLGRKQIVPCRTFKDLTGSNYSQCVECQTNSGFDLCLGCNGDNCQTNSDKAKRFCEEGHHVYLAYFANDKLKVGTAASYRKYERLLEQGALYSIFLAEVPNGRLARKIENEVSKLGITTRVNASYKMNNFVIDRTDEEIGQMLMSEYETILSKINGENKQYFIKPAYNNFTNISDKVRQNLLEESRQLTIFGGMDEPEHKEYEKVSKPECVSGEIKATVGSLILLKKDNRYSVVNMKSLEGWLVDFRKIELGEKNGSFEQSER